MADCCEHFYQEQIEPTLEKAGDDLSVKLWLSGILGVAVAREQDNSVRDSWVNHQRMTTDETRIGDKYVAYGVNAGIAGIQLWLDRENGAAHARALIFTGVTTLAMKEAFHRERPNQANHQSFPSGHTSSAFATATALTYAYGWKGGIPGFLMAGWTGASRIADDDHWFSDVVGGAFLGFIWGRAASHPLETDHSGHSLFYPVFQADQVGLGWMSHF